MKTREQQRAHDAYQRVEAKATEGEKRREDYGRVCVHLPEMIHQNGLCQTIAFLEAKRTNPEKAHFGDVLEDLAAIAKPAPGAAFAKLARTAESGEYQRLTREALACAQWLKRYAEALLKVDVSQRVGGR